jgi:hypothetical protein
MSFTANIRVLIASPSDLAEERKAAIEAVYEWNAQHASAESVVLLPVAWESHSIPRSGVGPQAAINEQTCQYGRHFGRNVLDEAWCVYRRRRVGHRRGDASTEVSRRSLGVREGSGMGPASPKVRPPLSLPGRPKRNVATSLPKDCVLRIAALRPNYAVKTNWVGPYKGAIRAASFSGYQTLPW